MPHSMVGTIVRTRLLDAEKALMSGCSACRFGGDVLCIQQPGMHWITKNPQLSFCLRSLLHLWDAEHPVQNAARIVSRVCLLTPPVKITRHQHSF